MGMSDLKKEFNESITKDYEKSVEIEEINKENFEMNAKLRNKKMRSEIKEIERSDRLQEEIENEELINRRVSRAKMKKDQEDRKKAVTFVNKTVSKDIIAAPGSLIVIASMTGNGK